MKRLQDIKATEQVQVVEAALGNGTALTMIIVELDNWLHIGVKGKGYYNFQIKTSGGYVAEKLGLMLGDAEIVSEWINKQLY